MVFCGSGVFAFLSGIQIRRTRLDSTHSSWVVSVPGVWVLVWYCMGSCARMWSSPSNTLPCMSESGWLVGCHASSLPVSWHADSGLSSLGIQPLTYSESKVSWPIVLALARSAMSLVAGFLSSSCGVPSPWQDSYNVDISLMVMSCALQVPPPCQCWDSCAYKSFRECLLKWNFHIKINFNILTWMIYVIPPVLSHFLQLKWLKVPGCEGSGWIG